MSTNQQPAYNPGESIPDDLTRRVVQLIRAGRGFCGQLRFHLTAEGPGWRRVTDIVLGCEAVSLSAALRAISSDEIKQLPVMARAGCLELKRLFEELVGVRWGWCFALEEDADQRLAEHLDRFETKIKRPLLAASLSLANDGELSDDRIVSDAYDAETRNLEPLPIGEARSRYQQLLATHDKMPIFGAAEPTWTEKDTQSFAHALGNIESGTALDRASLEMRELQPVLVEHEGKLKATTWPKAVALMQAKALLQAAKEPDNHESSDDNYIPFELARELTALKSYELTRLCGSGKVRSIGKGSGKNGRRVHAADLARAVTNNK